MSEPVKQNASAAVDADYSLEAVPESARKGFWQMFFVMLGFTFFSASMSVGAKLGNGLDLSGFVWACLIGGVILSAYCGVLAFIGSKTGLNMDLLCRRTFGSKGSYLSSAILGFTQIGWFGVGVAMFSIPAAERMGMGEWTLTIIAGLLMTATAATGMKALEIVSYISVPLIVVLGVYSMVTAAADGGGLAYIFAQSAGQITLFTGIGYVIGSFISGGTATPNFIRFAKNSSIAVWTTIIAFFLCQKQQHCRVDDDYCLLPRQHADVLLRRCRRRLHRQGRYFLRYDCAGTGYSGFDCTGREYLDDQQQRAVHRRPCHFQHFPHPHEMDDLDFRHRRHGAGNLAVL